jgi:hypothetical protein
MGVQHQLARMTAKGSQITGEGFGGKSDLSQTDIAWALSGLHGKPYWYMRLKFCGDTTVLPLLRNAMVAQMLSEAMAGGMDISAQTAPVLAMVAIMQATDGPVCKGCNGTGTVTDGVESSDCTACKGTGRLKMTQARAAELSGVSTPTYIKRHESWVDLQVMHLESYESQGLGHVSRRIYNEGEVISDKDYPAPPKYEGNG